MERITTKFADRVILPMMPISPYYNLKELDKFHEVRREYEEFAIKLAEYEDIGTIEEFTRLKAQQESDLCLASAWGKCIHSLNCDFVCDGNKSERDKCSYFK